jgi:hypothetical protein
MQWFRRIAVITLALTLVLLVLAIALSGGYSASLPPPLSETERNCITSTHFPVTVGVANYRHPVYSERLVRSLKATGLFDNVELLENAPQANIVARVNRAIYGTPTFPVVYLLTFGIGHSTVVEEWGEVFSLHGRHRRSKKPIRIEFVYEGPTTLGVAAWVFGLSPSRTLSSNPRETRRFHDALAAAICSQADEVKRFYTPRNKFQISAPTLPKPHEIVPDDN